MTSLQRTILDPDSWWSVADVTLARVTLVYRTGPAVPLREGRDWRRDERGRTALEAFSALPLAAMYERLEQALTLPEGAPRPEPMAELFALVRTFGPLGLQASRTFDVEVPEAEAWDRRKSELELKQFAPPGARVSSWQPKHHWRVRFPAVGEVGLPKVATYRTDPEFSWEERVRRADEGLPHDWLGPRPSGPLWTAHEDLQRALELTRALGEGSGRDVRHVLEEWYPLVLDYGAGEDLAALGLDWRQAVRPGARPAHPFKSPDAIDWLAFGRITLAATLDRQLGWTSLRVGLDQRGLALAWRVNSLLEVMYLQLLEHVQERLKLGVGTCGYCGGPILNVRKGQQWHATACGSAGRKRRSRAKIAAGAR